jgi:hypothetical protein
LERILKIVKTKDVDLKTHFFLLSLMIKEKKNVKKNNVNSFLAKTEKKGLPNWQVFPLWLFFLFAVLSPPPYNHFYLKKKGEVQTISLQKV